MRRLLVLSLVLLGVPTGAGGDAVAAACERSAADWRPGVRDARGWAEDRRGFTGFSVRTERWAVGWRERTTVPTASVLKALLLVAYLRREAVRDRPLRRADHALLDPMVRRSDNVTATRVRDIVGEAGLDRLARVAGLGSLSVHPVWGLSRLHAADGSRFMLALPGLVPDRHLGAALHLLGTIVPSQRWGLGRVRLPAGWRAFFKGGWGSGTGAVDHQVALLRGACGGRVAVAVMTTGQGSHAYGKRTLAGVFRRLLRGLPAEQRGG